MEAGLIVVSLVVVNTLEFIVVVRWKKFR